MHLVVFPIAIIVSSVLVEKLPLSIPHPIFLKPLIATPSFIFLHNKLDGLILTLLIRLLRLIRSFFINLNNCGIIFIFVSDWLLGSILNSWGWGWTLLIAILQWADWERLFPLFILGFEQRRNYWLFDIRLWRSHLMIIYFLLLIGLIRGDVDRLGDVLIAVSWGLKSHWVRRRISIEWYCIFWYWCRFVIYAKWSCGWRGLLELTRADDWFGKRNPGSSEIYFWASMHAIGQAIYLCVFVRAWA